MKNITLISTLILLNLALTACGGKDKMDPLTQQRQCTLATGGSVDCAKAVALAETPGGQQALIAAAQKAGVDPALLETPGSASSALIASQATKIQSALAATENDPNSPYYRGPASVSANSVDPRASAVSGGGARSQPASVAAPAEEAAPVASSGAVGGVGATIAR